MQTKTILVVEDDPIARKLTVMQLESLGFHSEAVSNGHDAIDAATTRRYTAILMDWHMPYVDGLMATAAIREWEQVTGEHVPIIAYTSSTFDGARQACLTAGMDDYLPKPAPLSRLREMLQRWVGQQHYHVIDTHTEITAAATMPSAIRAYIHE